MSSSCFKKLLVLGLDDIYFRNAGGKKIKENIISNYPEIIQENLMDLLPAVQIRILSDVLQKKSDLVSNEFWKNYVNESLLKFKDNILYIYENSSFFVLLNRAKSIYSDVDWFNDVLIPLSQAVAEYSENISGFKTVLEWVVNSDKNNLKKLLYRTETKKYPKQLKINLYRDLIQNGLLDQKLARRIRSDSSGYLSADILFWLFLNRTKYSDDDFQNLVLNFCDTKHKWVARFIALNMPKDLIPYLMGLEDTEAIKILEKRMS